MTENECIFALRRRGDKSPQRKKDPMYYQYLEIIGFSGIIVNLQQTGTGTCQCRFLLAI
jgi:hypothetical protein